MMSRKPFCTYYLHRYFTTGYSLVTYIHLKVFSIRGFVCFFWQRSAMALDVLSRCFLLFTRRIYKSVAG
jgi:hypothetical protein